MMPSLFCAIKYDCKDWVLLKLLGDKGSSLMIIPAAWMPEDSSSCGLMPQLPM
jgi:hypothetical protein